jgi:Nickel responsive protein SCO4226-like
MPQVGARSKRLAQTAHPNVTWEHSHVVVDDHGHVRTYCVYDAPDEAAVREHALELGQHVIDVIQEMAGDASPDDYPDV